MFVSIESSIPSSRPTATLRCCYIIDYTILLYFRIPSESNHTNSPYRSAFSSEENNITLKLLLL